MGLCFANSRIYYNLIGFCICVPTCFIQNVKNFRWFAIGAMAAILGSVVAITINEIGTISKNGINTTAQTWNFWKFPEYFGVICYAVEGVGTIMPIRSQMKHRKSFKPMFMYTMYGICVLLLAFGVLGVLCFGSSIKDIVFLNFPNTEVVIFVLMMVYGLGLILTFPVYINVTCGIIFRVKSLQKCFLEHEKAYWYCCIARLVNILLIFGISISGLKLLDLLNFSGSFCNSYLAIIMPSFLYMAYRKDSLGKWSKVALWIYMIVVCSCTLVSVYSSIRDVIVGSHHTHIHE